MPTRRGGRGQGMQRSLFYCWGVSLFELLIVVMLIAIAFALAMPMLAESKDLQLQEAAKMLAADLEMVQAESMAHADDPRLIKFDLANNRYWIAASSDPDTPITDPARGEAYMVTFGVGRAKHLGAVSIVQISLGGDDVLKFDAYGVPDQSSDASIRLSCGSAERVVEISRQTGDVVVRSGSAGQDLEVDPTPTPVTPAPAPTPAPEPTPTPAPAPAPVTPGPAAPVGPTPSPPASPVI